MLEKIFNLLADLIKSKITFLKILLRSNLFIKFPQSKVEDCIILGNGPSLKNVLANDLEYLKTHTILCVNKFPDTPAYEIVKPSYAIFISQEFWKKGTIKKHQDVRDNIVKALVNKTTWPVTLFMPIQAKKFTIFIDYIASNKNILINFFNSTPVEGSQKISHFYFRNNWGSPRPHNVLIPSILLMINSGMKSIHLLGADHSWLPLISVNDENVAMVNSVHFYDEGDTKPESMHKASRPRHLHEILEKFMLSFRAYFDLENYAKSRGTKIFNCTPNSFIDAFERKDLATLFTEKE